MRKVLVLVPFVMALFVPAIASAAIVSIAPFLGSYQEDWEPAVWGAQSWEQFPDHSILNIMGGEATLTDDQLAIWSYPYASAGTSGTSVAAHGTQGLGENGIGGRAVLTFADPMLRFGAYWQAYTPDYVPVPITFSFFDGANDLIGTQTVNYLHANGDGLLDWHGWQSTVGIKTVTWTETGGQSDWYQASQDVGVVPEPGSLLLLGAGVLGFAMAAGRRRHS